MVTHLLSAHLLSPTFTCAVSNGFAPNTPMALCQRCYLKQMQPLAITQNCFALMKTSLTMILQDRQSNASALAYFQQVSRRFSLKVMAKSFQIHLTNTSSPQFAVTLAYCQRRSAFHLRVELAQAVTKRVNLNLLSN